MTEPLHGRDDDLTALRTARASGAPGVVLSAAPGMGRTSVLGAIVDEWRDRRADVVLIRATASSRRLRFAALSPLLGDAGTDRALTFDVVHGALEERAARGGLVLAIDDAHLVDEASLRAVADLVGSHDSFVIASVDDTFRGLDPLTQALSHAVHTLAPLSPADVAALVSARTGEPADGETWAARSKGNPTALLHLLDDRSTDPGDAIPGGLRGDARRLLAVIALAEPFPLGRELASDDPVATARAAVASLGFDADAVDELVGRGIVAIVPGSEFEAPSLRMRHPGQSTRIRRALGGIEARSARRTALTAMRRWWPQLSATDRLRVASLAVEAGSDLTTDELLDVVGLAPSAGDPALALRLARRGVEQLGRFDDLRRLADVAHEQGAVDDLVAALDRMAATAATPHEHLAVAVARSQHLMWRCADAAGAVEALDRSPAADLPELRAIRARLLATVGRPAVALSEGEPLRLDSSPRVRVQASLAVAHALRRVGRPTRAVAVLDDALAHVQSVVDPVLSVSGQVLAVGRVLAMVEAGRWNDALAQATRVVSYAERYDESAGRAVALVVQAVAQIEAGSPALALAPLADAVELLTELRQPGGLRWALAARSLAHGLMADAAGARADLSALDAVGPHPADLFPSLEPRARAWALVAAADPEGARAQLRSAVEAFVAEGALGPAWQCAHELLSLDAPADLLELEPSPSEPLTVLRHRQAVAVQQHQVAELQALIDTYEHLGALRWAAECAAALSRAATRAGARDAGRRATERLGMLRSRCQGLDVPAITAGRLITLSVREREVALLAARGLSSREIAERLGVSARTVDNHLARCFDKLGTRSRSELGSLLDR